MTSYRVDNMTCGHCVSTITATLTRVDAQATVRVDLATRRLDIESTLTSAKPFVDALTVAGYPPVAIAKPADVEVAMPAKRRGCCCA